MHAVEPKYELETTKPQRGRGSSLLSGVLFASSSLMTIAAPVTSDVRTSTYEVKEAATRAGNPEAVLASVSTADESELSGELGALSEFVITGSHLSRFEYTGISPLLVVDREDFGAFGPDTLNDIARTLPINGGMEFQNETGNLIGMSQFNIRGLGLGSTLTLVNGRRAGVSTIADGGGNQFFDITQLPLSMVRHVEILTDGASATYGSQAVAGVVNIITRKGFEGLEISAKHTDAINNGQLVDVAFGSKGEKSMLNLYATYRSATRVDRTDLNWLLARLHHTGDLSSSVLLSGTGAPGSYQRAIYNPATATYLAPAASTGANIVPDPDCNAAGGVLVGARCNFDFSDQTSIIPEEKRLQMFAEGSYDASERLELFFEGSFSRNRFDRTLTPSLFENGLAAGRILIPASHPFNFFVADPANPNRIAYVDPADWDNSIHQAVDVSAIARPLGSSFKDVDREIDIDYWRGVAGFDYDISDDWSANFSYMHAAAKRTDDRAYEFVKAIVNDAALSGAWNPFGTAVANPTLVSPKDGISVAANTDEVLRSLWRTARDEAKTTQTVFDFTIAGKLLELFGEPVGLAVGAQYREEDLLSSIDPLAASGQGALQTTVTINPVSASQDITSYYAEATLPVGSDINLQLALRHERFSDGFDTTNPKIAGRWDATKWLALRGSYGTSFQAPSVRQKSTSSETAFIRDSALINPISGQPECRATGLAASSAVNTVVRTTGSDGLLPQDAESYALGLIFQPLSRLNASIDYWRFDYTNLITPDEGAQAIVENDCRTDGVPNDPRVFRDAGGQLRTITSFFINAGSVVTDGLDLVGRYSIPTRAWGELTFGLDATWIRQFEVQLGSELQPFDAAGSRNFTNSFRSTPQWRANGIFGVHKGAHRVSLSARYIDAYHNDQGNTEIASWTTLDAQYALSLPGLLSSSATLTVGANNLFDRDPPSLGDRIRPGYDDVIHDVRGRLTYVQLALQF